MGFRQPSTIHLSRREVPADLTRACFISGCRHPASRVSAKVVYNEFIADKNHIHMNSTQWLTLTEFVKYLGREGKCKVEETEKGWFITLIRVSRHADAQGAHSQGWHVFLSLGTGGPGCLPWNMLCRLAGPIAAGLPGEIAWQAVLMSACVPNV